MIKLWIISHSPKGPLWEDKNGLCRTIIYKELNYDYDNYDTNAIWKATRYCFKLIESHPLGLYIKNSVETDSLWVFCISIMLYDKFSF